MADGGTGSQCRIIKGVKRMLRYVVVSMVSGVLFGTMDALINAHPLAQKLYKVYEPIARTNINIAAGIVIDLIYGFVMAGIFLLIYPGLPGESGLVKGLVFGLIAWFFRVVMSAATSWMMFDVPINTLLYSLGTGLLEMLVLGVLYGLTLRPLQ
jgi:hypothetical protein